MSTPATRAAAAAAGIAIVATFVTGCSATKQATKDVASSATSSAASAAGSPAESAAGKTTLYYPAQEGAMFSIEAPANWKVGKIDQVGDFGTVESESGSVLQFRAQKFETEEATKKEVDDIVDSTQGFLKDNYQDVVLGDPKEITVDGVPGLQVAGTGKDKDGNAVKFLSAMVMLGPNAIAEIWAAVFPEGNNDLDTATAVLDSFKVAR